MTAESGLSPPDVLQVYNECSIHALRCTLFLMMPNPPEGHKSTNGFSKRTHDNINIFPQVYGAACMGMFGLPLPTKEGRWNEGFWNNTCIVGDGGVYFKVWETLAEVSPPAQPAFPVDLHDNRLFGKGLSVCMGPNHSIGGCSPGTPGSYTIEEWMQLGFDKSTTAIARLPSNDQIIEWAKAVLRSATA